MMQSDVWRILVGKVTVLLLKEGDRICEHMQTGYSFEPDTLSLWARLCGEQRPVLDVGAYSGLFSISAAKLGCSVVAFEPTPEMITRFTDNLEVNGLTHNEVVLHPVAVSDRAGSGVMHTNGVRMTAGASFLRKTGPAIKVPMVTIDSFGFQDIRAIKLDVERHECFVLRGARKTLARCRPTLIVEALDEFAIADVITELKDKYVFVGMLDVRNIHLEPV
jgi:FkbM family methyltransferase